MAFHPCHPVAWLALLASIASAQEAGEWSRISPFDGVRWRGPTPEVEHSGAWYELLAIDDLVVETLLKSARDKFGNGGPPERPLWKKRFEEDIVEVLLSAGWKRRERVKLDLRPLDGGEHFTVSDVLMSPEKRQKILRRLSTPQGPPAASKAVDGPSAASCLDRLEAVLDTRHAYVQLRTPEELEAVRGAIAGLRRRTASGTNVAELTLGIEKALALLGDCHAGVVGVEELHPAGYAPFLAGVWQERVFAFRPDRSGLVDPDHPFLREIDGRPIEAWMRAAERFTPRGSAHFVRSQSARLLRSIQLLRRELGIEPGANVRITLESAGGRRAPDRELRLLDRKPLFGVWPRGETRLLAEAIGYLRLPAMDASPGFLDGLHASLNRFRDTRGLIIDVRGNRGGSRDALIALLPYLMGRDEPPQVVNVAAFRLDPATGSAMEDDSLADRYLYPAGWSGWTAAESNAVAALAGKFRPERNPPAARFSDWRYMVVSRGVDPRQFSYAGRVVVLLDSSCFSATDIFLAALKGRRGVTLLGTPSGGGSGRALTHEIGSGIRVRLSSMASFRPDGRLYDGRGVEPDVILEPAPTDSTLETDTCLEAARSLLTGSIPRQ